MPIIFPHPKMTDVGFMIADRKDLKDCLDRNPLFGYKKDFKIVFDFEDIDPMKLDGNARFSVIIVDESVKENEFMFDISMGGTIPLLIGEAERMSRANYSLVSRRLSGDSGDVYLKNRNGKLSEETKLLRVAMDGIDGKRFISRNPNIVDITARKVIADSYSHDTALGDKSTPISYFGSPQVALPSEVEFSCKVNAMQVDPEATDFMFKMFGTIEGSAKIFGMSERQLLGRDINTFENMKADAIKVSVTDTFFDNLFRGSCKDMYRRIKYIEAVDEMILVAKGKAFGAESSFDDMNRHSGVVGSGLYVVPSGLAMKHQNIIPDRHVIGEQLVSYIERCLENGVTPVDGTLYFGERIFGDGDTDGEMFAKYIINLDAIDGFFDNKHEDGKVYHKLLMIQNDFIHMNAKKINHNAMVDIIVQRLMLRKK